MQMSSLAIFFSKVSISFSSLCLLDKSFQERNILNSVRILFLSLRIALYLLVFNYGHPFFWNISHKNRRKEMQFELIY